MHFYLKLANSNHVGILDVLLTETKLVTTENPGLLPLRVHVRQIRTESGTTTQCHIFVRQFTVSVTMVSYATDVFKKGVIDWNV